MSHFLAARGCESTRSSGANRLTKQCLFPSTVLVHPFPSCPSVYIYDLSNLPLKQTQPTHLATPSTTTSPTLEHCTHTHTRTPSNNIMCAPMSVKHDRCKHKSRQVPVCPRPCTCSNSTATCQYVLRDTFCDKCLFAYSANVFR